MAHGFVLVQWTPFKKRFDAVLAIGVVAFCAAYVGAGLMSPVRERPPIEIQLALRALGAGAFALLTLILAIGPLSRLSPRFLPLLYNRRHLGVTCFLLALIHAGLVVLWYHGFSDVNAFVSLLASNPRYDSIQGFPFESLGVLALLILFVLAATSHDFWNAVLGPNVWKALHMLVYWAYVLIVAHVMLGAVQGDKGPLYAIVVGAGAIGVATLHVIAGIREAGRDRPSGNAADGDWLEVGALYDIPDKSARVVMPPAGEKIAVFRDGDQIHAISNVCRHQGGPLGEGRIVDGCVTCPWHGFQYLPQSGRSPPPYSEQVAVYASRIIDGVVFVNPTPIFTPAELEEKAASA